MGNFRFLTLNYLDHQPAVLLAGNTVGEVSGVAFGGLNVDFDRLDPASPVTDGSVAVGEFLSSVGVGVFLRRSTQDFIESPSFVD